MINHRSTIQNFILLLIIEYFFFCCTILNESLRYLLRCGKLRESFVNLINFNAQLSGYKEGI